MENVSSSAADTTQHPKRSLLEKITGISRLFLLTVIAPTALATAYFGIVASDVYVSESRFVVRSAEQRPQMSLVGALLQGTGFARSQDDTYPIIDYIQSRDALRALNQNNTIRDAYSQQGDFISRFHTSFDGSFEALWKYYGRRIIAVDLDATSGITTLQTRAYSAEEATRFNRELLELSERLINRMNERAAGDTVQFAQRQVDTAAEKAKDAAAALAAFRNSHMVFDPDRQSALQLQQVASLQTQLFTAQSQLTQLQAISPQNPQIPVLKASIDTLQKQIKTATSGVAGGQDSLSQKATGYARLQLDAQFADKQLASAMAALENARGEAERKQLYLERLIEPNKPDIAIEPKRIRGILTALVVGLVTWGALSLLLASVREHRD